MFNQVQLSFGQFSRLGTGTIWIDFDKKTATVTYDPEQAHPGALTEATATAGYPSTAQGATE